ncbi:PD-(D/E)XK nuclease-like domain-containing protein [uncultured Parabacteroides sp.]|jgi:hypothetical protein|uniref:PD-(D/E)XK nuclease-like domain-containing protein n=1 Tax=uncultured Parabacteroides sp. TaxID=512312 RepID=UPI0025D5D462|nr:PD-(D/E)XK nuclease-like domain-containing protein [uncultured Parabacteroides sp.]
MEDLSYLAEGLNFQSLSSFSEVGNVMKSIDYTRPLNEYATPDLIASFLSTRENAVHIYSDSLRRNGFVIKEDMSKYLAAKDYINSGALKEAIKSPLHLFYQLNSGWKDQLEAYEKTKSYFVLGEFIHQAILEPRKFERVVIEPGYKLNTKDGVKSLIAFWEDKLYEAEEDEVSTSEEVKETIIKAGFDLDKMDGLRQYYAALKVSSGFSSVSETDKLIIDIVYFNYRRYGDGLFPELLKRSKRETSIYYEDPVYNLRQRIRPDAMQFEENIGANTIISVKSTRAESIGHFTYQSAKLNYELSEGMYCEIASAVTRRDFNCVITIMVQTIPPYGVAALVWDGEDIEIGKYKYHQALQTVSDCLETGKYPGYDAYAEAGNRGLIAMKQPEWNTKELHPVDIND